MERGTTLTLSGYRDSEEDEPTLSVVLESLILFVRGNNNATKLLVYEGKFVMDTIMGSEENSSRAHTTGDVKEFTWLRGIGIEPLPLKTRISWKK